MYHTHPETAETPTIVPETLEQFVSSEISEEPSVLSTTSASESLVTPESSEMSQYSKPSPKKEAIKGKT